MGRELDERIQIRRGDITKERVDAVVNAANSSLLGGGGVDGAIHRRGGPSILEECREIRRTRYPEGLPPGEAVLTGAGNLPCNYVIHTVGPVWHGGGEREREILASAYRNCLRIASENELGSIAFPAISTGIYGFPREKAGPIAYDTIRDHLRAHEYPKTVSLVFFSSEDETVFRDSIESAGNG